MADRIQEEVAGQIVRREVGLAGRIDSFLLALQLCFHPSLGDDEQDEIVVAAGNVCFRPRHRTGRIDDPPDAEAGQRQRRHL
jgi:hypothetical protein